LLELDGREKQQCLEAKPDVVAAEEVTWNDPSEPFWKAARAFRLDLKAAQNIFFKTTQGNMHTLANFNQTYMAVLRNPCTLKASEDKFGFASNKTNL